MAVAKNRKLTAENSSFSFNVKPTFSATTLPDGKVLRKFSGVAYTGDPILNHWFWDTVIFDMSSMVIPEKFAALIDHNGSQRAGYVTASKVSDAEGFVVEGNLLSNEHGTAVANDSDEGFPWQMSISISPSLVEEIMPGVSTTVNSRDVHGPCVVFRNSKISEVSFTAAGWDSNTSAAAMSRGAPPPTKPTGDTPMTPEEQARLDAAEARASTHEAANTALIAQLTAFSKSQRESAVKLLFSETGREFKADDADALELISMDDVSFNATAKFSRTQFAKFKPAEPAASPLTGFENLFAHIATGGADGAPQVTPKDVSNGLVDLAKKRAEEFSRRYK